MKKFIALAVIFAGITIAKAQETKPKETEDVRKTSTIPQKINNVVNPNDKEYNGYKVKKKTRKGKKYVKKVNTQNHTVRVKTKNAGDLDKKVQTTSTK